MSDLSEYHHIDLVTALRDFTVSPRMLMSRLACLPDDSALHASLRGEPRGWGTDRQLFASTVDAITLNSWVTASAASTRRLKKPKPLPRPNSKKSRRVVSVADLAKRGGVSDGGTGRP